MNANTTQTQQSTGADARLLLSYGQLSRSLPRGIHVLDIASSTGDDLLAEAVLQADVIFTGVDCNGSALREARQRARENGLENIEFEEVDFASPGGIAAAIDVPEGGFDIIQVSSLPRDFADLGALFVELKRVLAEHGVVRVELLGRKSHFEKVAHAIDGAAERTAPLAERLAAARNTIDRMVSEEPECADWRRASLVGDTEFVDRYMQSTDGHTNVAAIFDAIAASDMTFLRWQDAATWNFETLELSREELERVRSLPMPEQFRIVEEARRPEKLSFVIGGPKNSPRERFDLTKAGETHFMVHPDVVFGIETRNTWGTTQYDRLTVQRGVEPAVEVRTSPAQTALFALRDQREPFSGLNLVEVMTGEGATLEDALLALHQLVGMELVYRPHEFDVAQFYASMIAKPAQADTNEIVVTPSLPQKNSYVPAAGEPAAPLPAEEETASVAPDLSGDERQDS
jgi:ubiquinone/menaquinone biosynthesis C-methylase UbiE